MGNYKKFNPLVDTTQANGKIIFFMEKANFILEMALFTKALSSKEKPQEKVAMFITMGVFMRAVLKIMMLMVMGLIMIHFKGITTRVTGPLMFLLDKEIKNFQMALTTRASF